MAWSNGSDPNDISWATDQDPDTSVDTPQHLDRAAVAPRRTGYAWATIALVMLLIAGSLHLSRVRALRPDPRPADSTSATVRVTITQQADPATATADAQPPGRRTPTMSDIDFDHWFAAGADPAALKRPTPIMTDIDLDHWFTHGADPAVVR